MWSGLLSLGAKYVPGILRTVGSGLGKMLGGSSIVKTLGSKLGDSPIIRAGIESVGQIGKDVIGNLLGKGAQ
jgi:hypothetical protein